MIIAGPTHKGKTKYLINICNQENGLFVTKEETTETLRRRGLETEILEIKINSSFETVEEMYYFLRKITDKHIFVDNINGFINKRPEEFLEYAGIDKFSFSLTTMRVRK